MEVLSRGQRTPENETPRTIGERGSSETAFGLFRQCASTEEEPLRRIRHSFSSARQPDRPELKREYMVVKAWSKRPPKPPVRMIKADGLSAFIFFRARSVSV